MEELTTSFKKHSIQDGTQKFGGRLPAGWIDCPTVGENLIENFILPVKVPLHRNFRGKCGRKTWEVVDVLRTSKKYEKQIGMVVDLTDTHRYYNPEDFKQKGIGIGIE